MTHYMQFEDIQHLLICPECRGKLDDIETGLECSDCGVKYPVIDDVPRFIEVPDDDGREGFKQKLAANPAMYNIAKIGAKFLFPVWDTRSASNLRQLEKVVFAENDTPIILNVGSGDATGTGMNALSEKFCARMINLDVTPLPVVGIIAAGEKLPIANSSVDAIICKSVLEHVTNPDAVLSEAARVLKPGGDFYIEMPWLEGYHGYPGDYRRWTIDEFKRILSGYDFAEKTSGVLRGPASAAALFFREFLGSFTDNPKLKFILKEIIGSIIVWSWRFLDIYLARKKSARTLAATLYFWGMKNKRET